MLNRPRFRSSERTTAQPRQTAWKWAADLRTNADHARSGKAYSHVYCKCCHCQRSRLPLARKVMMNDANYLRAPTIFEAFQNAGAKVAAVVECLSPSVPRKPGEPDVPVST